MKSGGLAGRVEALLARHWWQPTATPLARSLTPLAALYGWLARRQASSHLGMAAGRRVPVPVIVVGNIVVGGAGKTPTVIALVQALQAAGQRPGVLSRGHGRRSQGVQAVEPASTPAEVGDEPLLIHRLTGVPVWVGADRMAAARALCAAHPEVTMLLSDDGLQHRTLPRQAELIVFDRRGAGNGLLLPAGPLREALPSALAAHQRVLYTGGAASTSLPGALALPHLPAAWPLAAWMRGDGSQACDLASLRGRPLVAAAGLAAPEKFFAGLDLAGLSFRRLPLPDHHDYRTIPWAPDTPDVLVTEKDAVKLDPRRLGATRVWVVPLDLRLPQGLLAELLGLLGLLPEQPASGPPSPPPAPTP